MASYTITGPFDVLGQKPGTQLTEDQLVDSKIDWLIESGHIVRNDGTPVAADAASTIPPITESAPAVEDTTQTAAADTTTKEG